MKLIAPVIWLIVSICVCISQVVFHGVPIVSLIIIMLLGCCMAGSIIKIGQILKHKKILHDVEAFSSNEKDSGCSGCSNCQ